MKQNQTEDPEEMIRRDFKVKRGEWERFCEVCKKFDLTASQALRYYVGYLGERQGEIVMQLKEKEGDNDS